MIRDSELDIMTSQEVLTSAASEDHYDTGPLATGNTGILDFGAGDALYLYFRCEITVAGTNPTYDVYLVSDETTTLDANSVQHAALPQFGAMTANDYKYMRVPPDPAQGYEQYVGLWIVVGGTATAGTFSAGFTRNVPSNAAVASGFSF